MILLFTLISIAAACAGLYYLLAITWRDLDGLERIEAVSTCTLLAIISVLALTASYVGMGK